MGRYILRRLLINIPVLFGITLVTYLIVTLAPGDPVSALVDPEQVAALGPGWLEQQRRELGLDRPLPVRYGLWIKEIATGNLGYSYADRQPVADKLSERIWPTVKLMLTVQLLALGILLGPLHVGAMWVGSTIFNLASADTYRRLAYAIIAASAIVAMPAWDGWLR